MGKILSLVMFILLNADISFAICVTKQLDPVAWNEDGNAVVLHASYFGPEGGGSDSYRIVDFKNDKTFDYIFSANFSDGSGGTSQTVSIGMCKQAVIEGNKMLKKLSFKSTFKDECAMGHVSLPVFDSEDIFLEKAKTLEIAKVSGLLNPDAVRLFGSSKDGVRLIVIEGNHSCDEICHKVVQSNADKSYKLSGSCDDAETTLLRQRFHDLHAK